MKKVLALLALGLVLSLGLAQTDTETTTEITTEVSVLDVIATNPDLTTLYSAIQIAGLEPTFMEPGPFTVFAPSNDAFLAAGIDPLAVSPTDLSEVLLAHVTAGTFASTDLSVQPSVLTLDGGEAIIAVDEAGALSVAGAPVSLADTLASNGVIHVIDSVILPVVDSMDDGTMDDSAEEGTEDAEGEDAEGEDSGE